MSPNKNNSKMAKPCNHMCSSAKYMYNPFPLWVGVILGVLFAFSASPHCRRLPPTPTVAPLFSARPKPPPSTIRAKNQTLDLRDNAAAAAAAGGA